ncbi:hypothetical protein GCT13_14405 [Paraburkholderia sp. CNPSo 3157]|uniref:Uncharacterized protein n=1 Tax=Paraburkholderia franconis TaxID=2654983 RepID=A0A7X1N9W4_9BURK|nr:hypothetical protein [Paraburkholderia franconis]MPW18099.1 hypothetical protein [Paraburkholderia franconis]
MRDDAQQLLVELLNLDAEISAGKAEIEPTQRWIERQPSEVAMDMFLTPLRNNWRKWSGVGTCWRLSCRKRMVPVLARCV